jgi:hypothetical protein
MAYKKTKQRSRKPLFLTGAVLLVACLVAGGFLGYHHYHTTKTTKALAAARSIYSKPVANPHVPGGSVSSSQGSGITSSKGGGGSSITTTPSSSVQPTAPVGEFVSDHKPNLSGSPAPNTETSTCTTTAGVQCQITFTSGSTTKSLPAQTTNAQGNTAWNNWTLQSIGLTAGTWKITAVATNGSQTASTTDVTDLTVSQ